MGASNADAVLRFKEMVPNRAAKVKAIIVVINVED
jgi:hypothetical protein